MRPIALSVTIAGFVGTSAIHLWQYLDGYSAAPNGWTFLVQAVAAAVLVALVVSGRDGIAAPAVASALQFGSLIARAPAWTSGFLGVRYPAAGEGPDPTAAARRGQGSDRATTARSIARRPRERSEIVRGRANQPRIRRNARGRSERALRTVFPSAVHP